MRKSNKGFTLIELIAVIAILGIIASAVVPKVGNNTKNAKRAKYLMDAKTIISAVELYNSEHPDSEVIKDDDTLDGTENDTVKSKLCPYGKNTKKYLNSWPREFPGGVSTLEQLKAFTENPDDENYY